MYDTLRLEIATNHATVKRKVAPANAGAIPPRFANNNGKSVTDISWSTNPITVQNHRPMVLDHTVMGHYFNEVVLMKT